MDSNRPTSRFNYGDWVAPTSISMGDASRMYWSWSEKDEARSHVGNYIKIQTRVWVRDIHSQPYGGYWKYLASRCWYHEDDLMLKEEYKLSKKNNKTVFLNLPITDLL